MTRDLPKTEWLTPKQALGLLREQYKDLTMADLASYCVELRSFSAYVRLKMARGEITDDQTNVYGHGDYAVLNPDDLFHGVGRVTVYLQGDVFDAPDPQASKLQNVEWEYTTEKNNFRILFKRSELEQLMGSSSRGEMTKNEESQPPLNHLLIIAKMLEMLKDPSRPSHNQESIAAAIAKEYDHLLGLGETSLRTLFSTANKVKDSVPPKPIEREPKIRLDKLEIQLD